MDAPSGSELPNRKQNEVQPGSYTQPLNLARSEVDSIRFSVSQMLSDWTMASGHYLADNPAAQFAAFSSHFSYTLSTRLKLALDGALNKALRAMNKTLREAG